MVIGRLRFWFLVFGFWFLVFSFVSANYYLGDIYFTVSDTVYSQGERIEIKGYVYEANYSNNGSLVSGSSKANNVSVNFTVKHSNGTRVSNYTFTTDANGSFYSRSNYYSSATQILAPSSAGVYVLRAQYNDSNGTTWFSEYGIIVVNKTVDILKVSPGKVEYSPSANVSVEVEAIKKVGDNILHVANVSVNGSLRNSSKEVISSFSCTTGEDGRCSVSLTAPSSYGDYYLELNDFKAFASFSVVPFDVSIYMKDEVGKSLKNIYAVGEEGRVAVSVMNASDSDVYSFSGYIKDSDENVVKTISSTSLNSNNSFSNSFLFTADALTFSYGAYTAYVSVTKSGGGSVSVFSSFEIEDWALAVNKRVKDSGFEYGYSTFANQTLRMEIYPTFRSNGTIITGMNSSFFTINMKDNLGNVLNSVNASWNASCGEDGCYEFSLSSPLNVSDYVLETSVSYSGSTQVSSRVVNVIDSVMSSQSTNVDGDIKELFGVNEYIYLSVSSFNLTNSSVDLDDAEVFVVEYMNGTRISYTQRDNFSLVNLSNSVYEWAWNSSLQRIKLDVPKIGGLYNVHLFGNNKSVGSMTKFIVNPYSVCSVPKDTPGSVSSGSYYYVWQFKTTDTIYFEMKIIQANNPLGKAAASNFSSANGSILGSTCSIDTTQQQAVSNATISIVSVKNLESGEIEDLNVSASTCHSDDSSGGYTCMIEPLDKWSGGQHIVEFDITGSDGTISKSFSRFEARAFYLYGYSSSWQNSPSSNVTLNVQMYEAGSGYWGNQVGGGLSGTVSLEKVEYQGRDGEWIWPPVDSGYNVSNINSSSITGSTGSISLPVSDTLTGTWKTGYYRAVLKGTTFNGESDYGYAWFGVKRWDVYGQPIKCTNSSCEYKNYFNSAENITLYIKISEAGDYSYGYSGGQSIGGNVSVGVEKIQDCRKWPCVELNSSQYTSDMLNVNESSPWYWNADISNESGYLLHINKTSGGWETGYYSVTLDINGTDTGYAWFNTIAFYVDTKPVNANRTTYKYDIKPGETMYFNVTTTKDYRGYSATYNVSDYVNTTLSSLVLRKWDDTARQSLEYSYPTDLNVSQTYVNGTALLNITYLGGNWPTGYYWGDLTLENFDNETSTGYLGFSVRPFRVSLTSNNYNLDDTACVNETISIYEPTWYSNSLIYGNYSIIDVYEDVWSGFGSSRTNFTNWTSASFNGTANVTICPNNGTWGSGSWGGHHYLNIKVRDNSDNSTENGWYSFKATPFQISWGSMVGGTNKYTNADIVIPVSLTTSGGSNTTGNLSSVTQWRYDNYMSTQESYVFSVGSCFSNVSGSCMVNGTQNVTVYAPSGGWKLGYNYLDTKWTKSDDSSFMVDSWSGIWFDGREFYNGYFNNKDVNGNWKYYFNNSANVSIEVNVRDSDYNAANVIVADVWYALSGDKCWDEWCRSYTAATWSVVGGGVNTTNGSAILNIQVPSSNWSMGDYAVKVGVSGSAGTATILGGMFRVKDMTAPNVTTFVSPTINQSVNGGTFNFNITTSESANCDVSVVSYDNFYNWYCSGWNSTNSTNSTAYIGKMDSCNITKYNFSGSTYYYEWVSKDYHSATSGANYSYWYSSGSTGMVTDGTTHSFVFNTTNKVTGGNFTAQDYGIIVWCYDEDWNYGRGYGAIKVNVTES